MQQCFFAPEIDSESGLSKITLVGNILSQSLLFVLLCGTVFRNDLT